MLDCKGLACPQPVMRAKEYIEAESPQDLEVLVDNRAASENVSRFLKSQGYRATVEARGDDYLVKGVRDADLEPSPEVPPEVMSCSTGDKKTVVFIRAEGIGRGDDTLGAGLMNNFLLTLKEMGPELWRLIFVNSGVKLCCAGSQSLPALEELEQSGVHILVCGTCLEFFELLPHKQVGQTTNMLDVVTSLQLADKVITV